MKSWDVDGSTDQPGMAPEREVAAWWDKLTNAQRDALGRKLYEGAGDMWAEWRWRCPWRDLAPLGQQMRLHMYYDDLRAARREH